MSHPNRRPDTPKHAPGGTCEGAGRPLVFAQLDDLIRAGWGDVPQTKIPRNWRELRTEQYGTIQELNREASRTPPHLGERSSIRSIRLIERAEQKRKAELDYDLAQRVLSGELGRIRDRRGRGPHLRGFDRPYIQQHAERMRRMKKGTP